MSNAQIIDYRWEHRKAAGSYLLNASWPTIHGGVQ